MRHNKIQRGRAAKRRPRTPTRQSETGMYRNRSHGLVERRDSPGRKGLPSYASNCISPSINISSKNRGRRRVGEINLHGPERNDLQFHDSTHPHLKRHISPDDRRPSPDPRQMSFDSRRRSPYDRRRTPDSRQIPPAAPRRSPDTRRSSPDFRKMSTVLQRRSFDARRNSPSLSPVTRRRSPYPRQMSPDTRRVSPGQCLDTHRRSPYSRQMSPKSRRNAISAPRNSNINPSLDDPFLLSRNMRDFEFDYFNFEEIRQQPKIAGSRCKGFPITYRTENRSILINARSPPHHEYDWDRINRGRRSPCDDFGRSVHFPPIHHNYHETLSAVRFSPTKRSPQRIDGDRDRDSTRYIEGRPTQVRSMYTKTSLSPKISPKLNEMELLTKVIYDESQPTLLPPPSVRKAIIMRNQSPNKSKGYRLKLYTGDGVSKQQKDDHKIVAYDDFTMEKDRESGRSFKDIALRPRVTSLAGRSRSPSANLACLDFSPARRTRTVHEREADYDDGYFVSPYGSVGPPRLRSTPPLKAHSTRKRSWRDKSPRIIKKKRRDIGYNREKDLGNSQLDHDGYKSRPIKAKWPKEPVAVHRRRRSYD